MHVITVAPIRRGIIIDELSYFTKEDIAPGALVTVPLRGRSTPALVIRSVPAEEAKQEIKHAEFALKKLERVHTKSFFSREFVDATIKTAEYFAGTTGGILKAVFPTALLSTRNPTEMPIIDRSGKHAERLLFQAEEHERFATYKSHIREVFARGHSCYFILPSLQDIEHAYASLEKGIEQYTFTLHSGLTKREIEKRWATIGSLNHPVLVIGTPLFLAIPRNDIEVIILDHESSGAYSTQSRPFFDLRFFAEEFAKNIGATFILGDLFLRAETLARKEQGEFEPLMRPKFRIQSLAKQTIIDMRTSGEQPATGRVAIASRELVELIERTRQSGGHCFILGVRRGIAPSTVCGDCGTTVTCERCSAPLVIHEKRAAQTAPKVMLSKSKEEALGIKNTVSEHTTTQNVFLCHRCGFERDTEITCGHCGGWRLVPLGIGVAHAETSIRTRFPDARVFRIDRDVIKKHSDAQKVIEEYYRTPGSILIGTEMALAYLTQPIATVAVLSVNSLLTIPDFRMGEKVFRLLLSLREKATENFLIQTRDPDMPLFALATAGNIGEFLRSELDVRHKLGYPPYTTLLKFTFEGGKADGAVAMAEIERIFGMYHPVSFPGFIARIKGKHIMNALIRIPQGEWPNRELLGLIRALPTEITVRVNPESVI